MFPAKRQSGLSVQPLGDELVVIDLERRDVFRLNPTAAWLWERCDGRTSVRDLAAALRVERAPDADEDTVWSSLHELSESGLLETPLAAEPGGISRRKLLATVALIGGAGVIAPLARGAMPAAAAPAAVPAQATSKGYPPFKLGPIILAFSTDSAMSFSHIEGLGAMTEVKYIQPGGDSKQQKVVPGQTKWTPVTVKRPLTSDQSLWTWQKAIAAGDARAIKMAKLSLLDTTGKPQAAWNLTNAWIDNLTILPADAGDVVFEMADIVLESSERLPLQ